MGRRSNGEGSLSKRKDGRWQAAYTIDGKRKYLYGKTRKEVAKKLREALAKTDNAYYPGALKLVEFHVDDQQGLAQYFGVAANPLLDVLALPHVEGDEALCLDLLYLAQVFRDHKDQSRLPCTPQRSSWTRHPASS